MKHIFTIVFIACATCSFGQDVDTLPRKKRTERKLEIGVNFTGRKANLGIGLTTGGNYFTRYNMYIGTGFELYYKGFRNNAVGAKVMNLSALAPITLGYKFEIDEFFAIPYAGLFGGVAWQSQIFNDGTSKNIFIADWGYTVGFKAGYDLGKVWPFLRVAYYNNFDGDKTDGHFFRAMPISVGILYNGRTHRKKHRHR